MKIGIYFIKQSKTKNSDWRRYKEKTKIIFYIFNKKLWRVYYCWHSFYRNLV